MKLSPIFQYSSLCNWEVWMLGVIFTTCLPTLIPDFTVLYLTGWQGDERVWPHCGLSSILEFILRRWLLNSELCGVFGLSSMERLPQIPSWYCFIGQFFQSPWGCDCCFLTEVFLIFVLQIALQHFPIGPTMMCLCQKRLFSIILLSVSDCISG